ncbi:hypothetical protein NFI96_018342 [Prochilodus magdalenae]|nr:hypothetical protein NFI96_018342 [Prochilodus magdalenae]
MSNERVLEDFERLSLYGFLLTAKMARDMSDKDILKMELDQLKKEVNTPRTAVSATAPELISYVEAQSGEDPLVKGVPEDKNPFKEKGGCIIT